MLKFICSIFQGCLLRFMVNVQGFGLMLNLKNNVYG
jgi:hypothetical protein